MTIQPVRRRLLACSGALLLARAMPARAAGPDAVPPINPVRDGVRALAAAIGPNVVLLNTANNAVRDIMRRALDFGHVMAQTGNDFAVMERTGVAMRLEREGDAPATNAGGDAQGRNVAGGYVGGDIDLNFNFDAWRHAFAVTRRGNDGNVTRSLEFFDAHGDAVHRLYLRNEAAGGLFDMLARDFRAPEQRLSLEAAPALAKAEEKPDSAIDVRQFRQAWLGMADAGQFGAIMADYGVTREQALRLAPPGMARQLGREAVRLLLDDVVRHRLPIMVLAGNAGITQRYTGLITNVAGDAAICAAQAPGFSLRLRDSAFRSGYAVRRAGVTSVEFFGKDGELAVAFLGVRERARPQAWDEVIQGLPKA